jgi:hypothetical protein
MLEGNELTLGYKGPAHISRQVGLSALKYHVNVRIGGGLNDKRPHSTVTILKQFFPYGSQKCGDIRE